MSYIFVTKNPDKVYTICGIDIELLDADALRAAVRKFTDDSEEDRERCRQAFETDMLLEQKREQLREDARAHHTIYRPW